jgi:hypothetical protein
MANDQANKSINWNKIMINSDKSKTVGFAHRNAMRGIPKYFIHFFILYNLKKSISMRKV